MAFELFPIARCAGSPQGIPQQPSQLQQQLHVLRPSSSCCEGVVQPTPQPVTPAGPAPCRAPYTPTAAQQPNPDQLSHWQSESECTGSCCNHATSRGSSSSSGSSACATCFGKSASSYSRGSKSSRTCPMQNEQMVAERSQSSSTSSSSIPDHPATPEPTAPINLGPRAAVATARRAAEREREAAAQAAAVIARVSALSPLERFRQRIEQEAQLRRNVQHAAELRALACAVAHPVIYGFDIKPQACAIVC